uniref:Uncharacterized protein n=1 Tax=Panagrolaimus superbus TaxID=310955 RepID=A0A914YWE2_9BILA
MNVQLGIRETEINAKFEALLAREKAVQMKEDALEQREKLLEERENQLLEEQTMDPPVQLQKVVYNL